MVKYSTVVLVGRLPELTSVGRTLGKALVKAALYADQGSSAVPGTCRSFD